MPRAENVQYNDKGQQQKNGTCILQSERWAMCWPLRCVDDNEVRFMYLLYPIL